jgi:2OG-Fe(II) oxygenase superfamily
MIPEVLNYPFEKAIRISAQLLLSAMISSASSMIQLTRVGFLGTGNLQQLATQFEQSHVLRVPSLLHPDLIRMVAPRLEQCTWTAQYHGEIAKETRPDDVAPASVLNFAANTPEFLEVVRRITGYDQIKCFVGRVYRMAPSTDHFDSWHADIGSTYQDRLVGMSVNLSPRPYQGGVLLIRDEPTGKILRELPNTGQGDAIFFRISPDLRHRVTTVKGTEPKTAYAGWFQSNEINFYSSLVQDTTVSPSTA